MTACGALLLTSACVADTERAHTPRQVSRQARALLADEQPVKQLALGSAHGCSLEPAISGVLCWGDDSLGQATVPTLIEPRAIAAGGNVSCAITATGARCWGDDSSGQLDAPLGLGDAVLLAVGDAHVCALTDDDEVRCWGDNFFGQLDVPDLRNIRTLTAGARHTCAIADGDVVCWGDDANAQLTPPELDDPQLIAAGGDHTCAIAGGEIRCWGGASDALLNDAPSVQSPRQIATATSHACVLDYDGVHCWGEGTDLKPRELTKAMQIAVGGGDGFGHACARHLQGIACWGDNRLAQLDYDGEPLHVLHRAESEIDADAEKIWNVLMDLDSYPLWNPYTIAMESTLQIGDPMNMTVKMSELVTLDQTEYIRVLEDGHKVCWGIDTSTPEFNSGERCQWLEPLADGRTRYVTEDLIEGTANPLVSALFGDDVEQGFEKLAVALKEHVESLGP